MNQADEIPMGLLIVMAIVVLVILLPLAFSMPAGYGSPPIWSLGYDL